MINELLTRDTRREQEFAGCGVSLRGGRMYG